jgi:hypothetical protein
MTLAPVISLPVQDAPSPLDLHIAAMMIRAGVTAEQVAADPEFAPLAVLLPAMEALAARDPG